VFVHAVLLRTTAALLRSAALPLARCICASNDRGSSSSALPLLATAAAVETALLLLLHTAVSLVAFTLSRGAQQQVALCSELSEVLD
jgi:hypothetical protein